MHRRRSLVLALVALTLLGATLACEGSGSTTQSCTSGRGSGSCQGTLGKLSGTRELRFENDSLNALDVIEVTGEFKVGSGQLDVGYTTPDGQEVVVRAAPGQPAQVAGSARGFYQALLLNLTAVDGEASEISYALDYQVR